MNMVYLAIIMHCTAWLLLHIFLLNHTPSLGMPHNSEQYTCTDITPLPFIHVAVVNLIMFVHMPLACMLGLCTTSMYEWHRLRVAHAH